jgi:hypothetical protein
METQAPQDEQETMSKGLAFGLRVFEFDEVSRMDFWRRSSIRKAIHTPPMIAAKKSSFGMLNNPHIRARIASFPVVLLVLARPYQPSDLIGQSPFALP